ARRRDPGHHPHPGKPDTASRDWGPPRASPGGTEKTDTREGLAFYLVKRRPTPTRSARRMGPNWFHREEDPAERRKTRTRSVASSFARLPSAAQREQPYHRALVARVLRTRLLVQPLVDELFEVLAMGGVPLARDRVDDFTLQFVDVVEVAHHDPRTSEAARCPTRDVRDMSFAGLRGG